jgi:hypothetical protein
MSEMISYCGLTCTECPAYIATQKDDMEAAASVAEEWGKQFGMEVLPESVLCDGCKSEAGKLCGYCNICAVRACGIERTVVTCAQCEDYGCETLRACPAYIERGKETLERLRS